MERWYSRAIFWDLVFSVALGVITLVLVTTGGDAWADVLRANLDPARDFEAGITTCGSSGSRPDRWFFDTGQILRTQLTEEAPYTLTIYYRDGNLLTIPLADMHEEGPIVAEAGHAPQLCRVHRESGRIVPFQMTPEVFAAAAAGGGSYTDFLSRALPNVQPRFDRNTSPDLLSEVLFQQTIWVARSFTEIGGYYAGCGTGGMAGTGIQAGRRVFTSAMNRLLTRLGESAVIMQGPNGVVRVGELLAAWEIRNPHVTTLFTRLTSRPEAGRLLFTGTDLTLPAVARAAGTTYRGRIPTVLLNLFEDAGLVTRNRAFMNGVVGEEIRISPQAAEWLAPLFQAM